MRLGKLRYESKYLAIRHFHETKGWGIGWMCRQLEVSRSAYYKWTHREIPGQEQENIKLAGLIKEYDERFHHILGYRRMTSWINHFNHTTYSKNRVHRTMKKLRIHSVTRKKKKKYSPYAPQTMAENKLSRDFYATTCQGTKIQPVFLYSDALIWNRAESQCFRNQLCFQTSAQCFIHAAMCLPKFVIHFSGG